MGCLGVMLYFKHLIPMGLRIGKKGSFGQQMMRLTNFPWEVLVQQGIANSSSRKGTLLAGVRLAQTFFKGLSFLPFSGKA